MREPSQASPAPRCTNRLPGHTGDVSRSSGEYWLATPHRSDLNRLAADDEDLVGPENAPGGSNCALEPFAIHPPDPDARDSAYPRARSPADNIPANGVR